MTSGGCCLPSQIFDVQFNPHAPGSLVTCGVKHIKFWTLCGNTLMGKKGIFGKKGQEFVFHNRVVHMYIYIVLYRTCGCCM